MNVFSDITVLWGNGAPRELGYYLVEVENGDETECTIVWGPHNTWLEDLFTGGEPAGEVRRYILLEDVVDALAGAKKRFQIP